MKAFFVWLLTDAMSIELDGTRYVPDWEAIAALAAAAAVTIGLFGIWYSIHSLRRQFRHQTELEAKQVEQGLLLRVMDRVEVPYRASRQYVADVMTWHHSGGSVHNLSFFAERTRAVVDAHGDLSSATASALAVLRRSRLRRFPRGTSDEAMSRYQTLIDNVIRANAEMLTYATRDVAAYDLVDFQNHSGALAFEFANILRRVSAELIARMYADEPEWSPLKFEWKNVGDAEGFDFADDPPVATR